MMLSDEDRRAAVDLVVRFNIAARQWLDEVREESRTRREEARNVLDESAIREEARTAFRREIEEYRERCRANPGITQDEMIRDVAAMRLKHFGESRTGNAQSEENDGGDNRGQIRFQQVYQDFFVPSDNPSYCSMVSSSDFGESEGTVESVTLWAPETFEVLIRHVAFGGSCVQRAVVRNCNGKWLIEKIHCLKQGYPDQIEELAAAVAQEQVYNGPWETAVPRPWHSELPGFDVEERYPFLRGKGREAVRLHPEPARFLDPLGSKIGGSIAWPKDEEFPVCPERRCQAVPLLQLHLRDVPQIPFPAGTDLFQLLWYPQFYEMRSNPPLLLFWRDSSQLTRGHLLRPAYTLYDKNLVVRECRIHPEPIIEYPPLHLLTEEQRSNIPTEAERMEYNVCLSAAPGIKAGGYPAVSEAILAKLMERWEKRHKGVHFLTLAHEEWTNRSQLRWRPRECAAETEAARDGKSPRSARPTGLSLPHAINIGLRTNIEPWLNWEY